MIRSAVALLAAFGAGSIPTGYLVARARGIDIRQVGSGNIGATNVVRALGRGWGGLTLALDMLKGAIPVLALPGWAAGTSPSCRLGVAMACAAAAVAGHNWTPFLRFRGGKGVATGAGALTALAPVPVLAGLAVWAVVFGAGRIVSLASMAAAAVMPLMCLLFEPAGRRIPLAIFTAALGAITIGRHRANIVRLMEGREPRAGWNKTRRDSRSG